MGLDPLGLIVTVTIATYSGPATVKNTLYLPTLVLRTQRGNNRFIEHVIRGENTHELFFWIWVTGNAVRIHPVFGLGHLKDVFHSVRLYRTTRGIVVHQVSIVDWHCGKNGNA
jgi:hypothetical protein